ncbi:MAG: DNA primase, partial [Nitrospirae bacterium]
MLVELNLAARDDPGNPDICRRLCDCYMDRGDLEKAARSLLPLIKKYPKKASYYKDMGRILEQAGNYDKAVEIYKIGYKHTGDEYFKRLIQSIEIKQEKPIECSIEKGEQIVPSTESLLTFTTLFSGREGVYARQWSSPTGETGYTPVHEPFTLKVAQRHIMGDITVGVYPIRMDNTVNFIAFDLDLPKFVINKAITRESLWKKAIENVYRRANQLIDKAAAYNIPIYLEDSGFKGFHCWIFLEMPIPAGVAKKFGELLLTQLDKSTDVMIEIFPKQGSVRRGSLGNLIKLPLGFHRKTGRRSLFIDPKSGKPVKNQLDFTENFKKTPRRAIYSLIQ